MQRPRVVRAVQSVAGWVVAAVGIACLLGGVTLFVVSIVDAFTYGLDAINKTTVESVTGLAGVGIFTLLLKLKATALIAIANGCLTCGNAALDGSLGVRAAGKTRRFFRRHSDGIAAGAFLLVFVPLVFALVVLESQAPR